MVLQLLHIWHYTFLFHWSLCSFVDLHGSCDCLCAKVRSKWIGESWIRSAGGFQCWNWRLSPVAEFHRSIWVWVLLCIGEVCFLLMGLIFFRVASAFVLLSGWAVTYYHGNARNKLLHYASHKAFWFVFRRRPVRICERKLSWLRLLLVSLTHSKKCRDNTVTCLGSEWLIITGSGFDD
jgi:hypothetical protein